MPRGRGTRRARTFDAQGNQVEKQSVSTSDTWLYGYDTLNRLTSVTEKSNGTTVNFAVTYTYDVQNNLVQESTWTSGVGTVVTRFDYDGTNVWAQTDGSNNLLVRYTWGPGTNQILTRTTASGANAGVEAYFTDRLGSVVDIQNWATGALVDHSSYTGYGVRTDSNAGVGDGYGYTGVWSDSNTGLQWNNARWYDPKQGRWISEDPIGFAGGQSNLSQYVGNDPMNLTDPSGLAPAPDPIPLPKALLADEKKLLRVMEKIRTARQPLTLEEMQFVFSVYITSKGGLRESARALLAGRYRDPKGQDTPASLQTMVRFLQQTSVYANREPTAIERKTIAKLIDDLDSDTYQVRSNAKEKLRAFGSAAMLQLLARLKEKPAPSLEQRRSITLLVGSISTPDPNFAAYLRFVYGNYSPESAKTILKNIKFGPATIPGREEDVKDVLKMLPGD
jgi:RHS repeat-associated protein